MREKALVIALLLALFLLGCIESHVKEEEVAIPAETAKPDEDPSFIAARAHMIEAHLKARGITDERVLEAMGTIPRQEFVSADLRDSAYSDHPLPIGEGQTISQPYVVALMTQALRLQGDEKVLEIGTGSGYQAAVLAELVDEVYTIEIVPSLSEVAEVRLERLGYENVEVKNADGYFGWKEHAPFDAVMITAAADHVPPELLDQLKDGGQLIMPLGSTKYYQTLTLLTKEGGEVKAEYLIDVRFVPMTGEAQKGEE